MFSKNLRYYRLKNFMTQKQLAEKVGLAPSTITHYERGSRTPSMEILKALAEALGIHVSDFLLARKTDLVFSHSPFQKDSSSSTTKEE